MSTYEIIFYKNIPCGNHVSLISNTSKNDRLTGCRVWTDYSDGNILDKYRYVLIFLYIESIDTKKT